MFMDKPYPVFAEALTDSTLLFIDRAVVFDLLAIDTSFARKLLAGLSQRLHGLVQDVETTRVSLHHPTASLRALPSSSRKIGRAHV